MFAMARVASSRTKPPAVPGRRTADRRAHRSTACRCGSWSWRAPARSCRRHAGVRRRAHAGEARRGSDRARRRMPPTQSASVETSISTPSRAKAALCRFSGRWSPNLPTRIMASRLGPAKPRGIGCDGAGGSVIASQSRQANFSRTRSMIFQRRGSHSSVLETTSPSLRSRAPPHLPQAQGAGSTTRSTGRLSGSLRGPRGARRRVAPWRPSARRSRPWSLPRPAFPPGPRSPVRAARRVACRVPRTDRIARGAPWPAVASAARSQGRGLSLRSAPRPASRVARGSSRGRSPGRSGGSAGRRQVCGSSRGRSRAYLAAKNRPQNCSRVNPPHSSRRLGTPGFLRHPPIDARTRDS